jgi:hypothetical protein
MSKTLAEITLTVLLASMIVSGQQALESNSIDLPDATMRQVKLGVRVRNGETKRRWWLGCTSPWRKQGHGWECPFDIGYSFPTISL